jgi:hypothetical protein
MGKGAFEVRCHHLAIRAKWQVPGAVADRLACPHLLPVAIAAGKKVLRIESVQEPRDRRLEACVLCGGDAQRAPGALALRAVVPAHPCGSVALRLHALHEGGDRVMQTFPIGSCPEAVDPRGRTLVQERPAAAHLSRACRVTEIEGIGERFQPKEHQVLFLG